MDTGTRGGENDEKEYRNSSRIEEKRSVENRTTKESSKKREYFKRKLQEMTKGDKLNS